MNLYTKAFSQAIRPLIPSGSISRKKSLLSIINSPSEDHLTSMANAFESATPNIDFHGGQSSPAELTPWREEMIIDLCQIRSNAQLRRLKSSTRKQLINRIAMELIDLARENHRASAESDSTDPGIDAIRKSIIDFKRIVIKHYL